MFTVGIDYDEMMQLQPQHIKLIIPDLNERFLFQSMFFKAVLKESESTKSNSVLDDTFHDDDDQVHDADQGLDDVQNANIQNDGEHNDRENVARTSSADILGDDAMDIDEEYKGDKFELNRINDLDFDIIIGKYGRTKSFKAGERIELAQCVIRHILKTDPQRM